MRYFDGYKREDGRVGTRNYVAIISGVNCSASVSQFVKDRFRDVQKDFPNVDGVLAITHKSGCGTKLFGEDHMALQRVLAGYAKHPNVAAYILVGLGCEVNQAAVMVEQAAHGGAGAPGAAARSSSTSRRRAGSARRSRRATREVAKLLPFANEARRTQAAGVRARRWPPTAAARTATPGSPPTPRSAGPWTSWCATAAPACSPRRPRSTAPSTC